MIGISRITFIYSNIIFNSIENQVDRLLKGMITRDIKVIIGSKEIQENIIGYEDDFLDYPIRRIRILLSLNVNKIPKTHPNGYDTTGGMWPFDIRRNKLSYVTKKYDVNFSKRILSDISVVGDIKVDLGMVVDPVRFHVGDIPKLKLELMSLIMHELNHGYEFWLRHTNNIDDMRVELGYLDLDKKRFSNKVYKKVKLFLYYIYRSLPHEQNATVQELYPYVLTCDINELIKLPSYQHIIDMINFNSDRFYGELCGLIPENGLNKVTNNIVTGFFKSYKEEYKDCEELMDKTLLGKEKIDDIFKYYEKSINLAGENMRRKILRLYSIKNDLK